jgi:hypothetical protein
MDVGGVKAIIELKQCLVVGTLRGRSLSERFVDLVQRVGQYVALALGQAGGNLRGLTLKRADQMKQLVRISGGQRCNHKPKLARGALSCDVAFLSQTFERRAQRCTTDPEPFGQFEFD